MRAPFAVLVVAAVAVALVSAGTAHAHDLRLTVKLPPETPEVLLLEAAFDDDTPADEAKVTLTDATGAVIATAKTDEKGVSRLTRPGPGKYKATAEAFGHRDAVEFEVAAPAAAPLAEVFAGARPDRNIGLVVGVVGLLTLSLLFWGVKRRRCCGGC